MSSYLEKRLVPGSLLTNSAATYYTCASPVTKTIIKEMTFCNTDNTGRTITLHIIPSGGTIGDANKELHSMAISSNTTVILSRNDVMEQGSFIQAFADAGSKVAFSCSGVEKT